MAPGAYRVSGDFDSESRRKKDYRLESRYHRDSDLNRRDLVGANCRDSNRRNSSNGFSHADNYQKYPPRSRSPVVRKKPDSDRELGELSSGSESEKLDMRREISRSKENGHRTANKETKETGPSPSKKRKFSPIVWSKTKNEGSVAQSLLNSSPSPPLAKSPMDLDSEVSVNSPRNPCINGDREPGQIEEEDELYPTTRTISSSRWAENDDDLERETNKKVSSPEPGDSIIRESSVITVSRSSNSDREEREDDSMEIDRENGTDHESDSEFEREDTPEPEKPAHRSINMLEGCRSVDEFERLNKINEGTYGVVFRARDKKTGEIVALKKIKMERETEGFPLTSLREINILLSFHHSYIVDVKEVVMGSSLDSIFMVMEYMEHDLKGVMEAMKQPYSQSEVKCLMIQLLEGVKYLHDNWVLHRDLKTSNLLLNNNGELKICDFGMARQYGSPLKPYTQLVVTLWYRAPELLLGGKEYSTAVDMWSIGCIMAELLTKQPLFAGESEIDQVGKIFKVLGTPSEEIWPGYKKLPGSKVRYVTHKSRCNTFAEKLKSYKSSNAFSRTFFHDDSTLSKKGFELLDRLLTYDPKKRISAEEALEHPWFKEVPLPKSKDFMPTFPSQNDKDRRKKTLQGDIIGSRGLFG